MFQLANGMQVVLIPTTGHRWSRTCSGTGSGQPTRRQGKSGLAHFFEHLMFKGTSNHPGDAYLRLIGRAGGERQRLHLL